MPRGGKRPGAGAPRGNFNAFKNGEHSLQLHLALHYGRMQDFRTISHRIALSRAKKRARSQASAASKHPDGAYR